MSEIFSSRALLAMQTAVYIAYHGKNGAPVKSSRIIERYRLNKRALEPILQTLARAGVVESKQGANGGYIIANADKVTLRDIAEPFIDKTDSKSLAYGDLRNLLLPSLHAAYEDVLARLGNLTLAEISARADALGISRNQEAPLDFII
jgi:Rrf2 family transcriptional regulator, iron-sulfur cluster assembly transcription factor